MDEKYINADKLFDSFMATEFIDSETVSSLICNAPSEDVVDVVRCKDCIHSIMNYDPKTKVGLQKCDYRGFNPVQSSCVSDNDYCSHGEKTENTDICEKTPDSEFNHQDKRAFQEEKLNALKAENDCLKKELTDINDERHKLKQQNEFLSVQNSEKDCEISELTGMVEAFKFSISKGACDNE